MVYIHNNLKANILAIIVDLHLEFIKFSTGNIVLFTQVVSNIFHCFPITEPTIALKI